MADDKFSFRTIPLKAFAGLFSDWTHTSLRGCRCAFSGSCDLQPNFSTFALRPLLTSIIGGGIPLASALLFGDVFEKLTGREYKEM